MTNIPEIELVRDELTGELIPEIWKPIPDWEDIYEVSNYGRVKSLKFNKERLLKPRINSGGYFHVKLCLNNQENTRAVHILVAMVFLDHTPCGHTCVINHKNLNKRYNFFKNLEIVTNRENSNKKHLKSSSQYVGVVWAKDRNRWRSRIFINGKTVCLGQFKTENEASNAYQEALRKINN